MQDWVLVSFHSILWMHSLKEDYFQEGCELHVSTDEGLLGTWAECVWFNVVWKAYLLSHTTSSVTYTLRSSDSGCILSQTSSNTVNKKEKFFEMTVFSSSKKDEWGTSQARW